MATPWVNATFRGFEEDADLHQTLHMAFRGVVARGDYLAADWIDAEFACKEICRYIANATQHAWRAFKRLCRYFSSTPRFMYEFHQQSVQCVDMCINTDLAGCPKTGKSISGGVVMLGTHNVKHWSST